MTTSPSPPPRSHSRGRVAKADWDRHLHALLADLQNTISPGGGVNVSSGYGSLNGTTNVSSRADYATVNRTVKNPHAHHPPPRPPSPTYQNETPVVPNATSTPGKLSTSLNNNLSELDTLLQDLSNSRYSSERHKGPEVNGTTNAGVVGRPSVDSLLDELNTPLPNGGGGGGDLYQKIIMEETTTTTTTRQGRPTASSATKELDDLMASLSDFKVSGGGGPYSSSRITTTESTYAKPTRSNKQQHHQQQQQQQQQQHNKQAAQLDCMLGSLQADMSRQGVNTTQKGCCNACDKPIVGQVITALGKTWHPEHFTCTHCTQELGTRNFFERDGHPYCETDYHNLFSPRCAYCNGPILDKCVTALEKTWHTEHFFCAQCGKQFGEEGFHERDGKPYCRDDYFDMFAPKCGGCNRPIMENYVSALSSQWHADCFVCRDCRKAVSGKSFYAMEGKPVCPACVGVDEED